MAPGERSSGFEREGEGMDLVEEPGVGDAVARAGVDEDVGVGVDVVGSGIEERESKVDDREGLRRRREWNLGSQAVEGLGLRAETALGVDPNAAFSVVLRHGTPLCAQLRRCLLVEQV